MLFERQFVRMAEKLSKQTEITSKLIKENIDINEDKIKRFRGKFIHLYSNWGKGQ